MRGYNIMVTLKDLIGVLQEEHKRNPDAKVSFDDCAITVSLLTDDALESLQECEAQRELAERRREEFASSTEYMFAY